MKKLAAFAAAVALGAILTATAWQDNSAQDAADHATQHGPLTTCKAVR